jgi:hypothetical protein
MPQFDFYSFPSQAIWILLIGPFFYFFILKSYIVSFLEIFKMRFKLFNNIKFNNFILKKKIYVSFFFNI